MEPDEELTIEQAIEKAEQTFKLPKGSLYALANRESGVKHYKPNGGYVTSKTGATGVFQFTGNTARGIGINKYSPVENIVGAAKMFRDNYDKLRPYLKDDTTAWAAAAVAHNRGLGLAQSLINNGKLDFSRDRGDGINPQSRQYATEYLQYWNKYLDGTTKQEGSSNNPTQDASSQQTLSPIPTPANDAASFNLLNKTNPQRQDPQYNPVKGVQTGTYRIPLDATDTQANALRKLYIQLGNQAGLNPSEVIDFADKTLAGNVDTNLRDSKTGKPLSQAEWQKSVARGYHNINFTIDHDGEIFKDLQGRVQRQQEQAGFAGANTQQAAQGLQQVPAWDIQGQGIVKGLRTGERIVGAYENQLANVAGIAGEGLKYFSPEFRDSNFGREASTMWGQSAQGWNKQVDQSYGANGPSFIDQTVEGAGVALSQLPLQYGLSEVVGPIGAFSALGVLNSPEHNPQGWLKGGAQGAVAGAIFHGANMAAPRIAAKFGLPQLPTRLITQFGLGAGQSAIEGRDWRSMVSSGLINAGMDLGMNPSNETPNFNPTTTEQLRANSQFDLNPNLQNKSIFTPEEHLQFQSQYLDWLGKNPQANNDEFGVRDAFDKFNQSPKSFDEIQYSKKAKSWNKDYNGRYLQSNGWVVEKSYDGGWNVYSPDGGLVDNLPTLKETKDVYNTAPPKDLDNDIQFSKKSPAPINSPEYKANLDLHMGLDKSIFYKGSSGEYETLFHGTKAEEDFPSFRTDKGDYSYGSREDIGIHFGTKEAAQDRVVGRRARMADRNEYEPYRDSNARVGEYYVSIKRPIKIYNDLSDWTDIDAIKGELLFEKYISPKEFENIKTIKQLRTLLESKGYDGIKYLNQHEGVAGDADAVALANKMGGFEDSLLMKEADAKGNWSYIAFEPEQAKSKFNLGSFDSTNKDMMKSGKIENGRYELGDANNYDPNNQVPFDSSTPNQFSANKAEIIGTPKNFPHLIISKGERLPSGEEFVKPVDETTLKKIASNPIVSKFSKLIESQFYDIVNNLLDTKKLSDGTFDRSKFSKVIFEGFHVDQDSYGFNHPGGARGGFDTVYLNPFERLRELPYTGHSSVISEHIEDYTTHVIDVIAHEIAHQIAPHSSEATYNSAVSNHPEKDTEFYNAFTRVKWEAMDKMESLANDMESYLRENGNKNYEELRKIANFDLTDAYERGQQQANQKSIGDVPNLSEIQRAASSTGGNNQTGKGEGDTESRTSAQDGTADESNEDQIKKKIANINANFFGTKEEAKNTLNALADEYAEEIFRQKRGVRTNAETEDAAQKLIDMGLSIENVKRISKGTALPAEKMLAVGKILSGKVEALSEKMSAYQRDGGIMSMAEAIKEAQDVQVAMASLAGTAAETGRALQILKTIAKAVDEAVLTSPHGHIIDLLRQMVRKGLDPLTNEELEILLKIDPNDKRKIVDFIRARMKFSSAEKLHAFYIANILSSPATHGVNTISNVIWMGANLLERPMRGLVDRGLNVGTKREFHARETLPAVAGLFDGIPIGLKKAAYEMSFGYGMDKVENLDIPLHYTFPSGEKLDNFRAKLYDKSKFGKLVAPLFQNPWNMPTRFLEASDALFRAMNTQSEVNAVAMRTALNEGLKGQELKSRYIELRDKPTVEMMAKAETFGKYATFKDSPGFLLKQIIKASNTSVNDVIRATEMAAAFAEGKDPKDVPYRKGGFGDVKPLRWLVPFLQTPANIAKAGVMWSPVGLAKVAGHSVLSEGYRKSGQLTTEVSRALLGSLFMSGIALLLHNDEITGDTPRDPRLRDIFFQSGKQPYAIRVGNKWVSYRGLGPVAYAVTVVGDIRRELEHNKNPLKERAMGKKIASIAGDLFKDANDMSALQNFGALFSTGFEDTGLNVERTLTSTAKGMVPMAGFTNALSQTIDPNVKEPGKNNPDGSKIGSLQEIANRLFSGIPGYSRWVPNKMGQNGQPLPRPGGLWPFAPIRVTNAKDVNVGRKSPINIPGMRTPSIPSPKF